MNGPIVRGHVARFTPGALGWSMELSGTGSLPSEVIKAIAGGPVLVTFQRGSGGAVVEAERRERIAETVR